MSGNLFLNAERDLQRLETLLLVLKRYNLTMTKDKILGLNGNPTREIYHATVTYTRHDGQTGYINVDGDNFPDLFQKISDKLQTT